MAMTTYYARAHIVLIINSVKQDLAQGHWKVENEDFFVDPSLTEKWKFQTAVNSFNEVLGLVIGQSGLPLQKNHPLNSREPIHVKVRE